jgi:hypothetical protein
VHTTKIGGVTFAHNGDFSGDVIILSGAEMTTSGVVIPFAAMKGLVAEYVRHIRIVEMETRNYDEVLGGTW